MSLEDLKALYPGFTARTTVCTSLQRQKASPPHTRVRVRTYTCTKVLVVTSSTAY